MLAYAVKAAREGKVETSWTNPNEAYEDALAAFVRDVLDPARSGEFIDSFQRFAERTALLGALNGLAQIVLKATIPGVPDIYQGTEFWDLSLVDPDNRRPVDYAARRDALAVLSLSQDWAELASYWRDGRIKLAVLHRLLAYRRVRRTLFERGGYRPLTVSGRDSDKVFAFARATAREAAVIVVGRHFAVRTGGGRRWPQGADWDATLHLEGYTAVRNVLYPRRPVGGEIALSDLFGVLPLALLEATPRRG